MRHLRERIERLKSLKQCTFEEYLADDKLRDAVERNFQVAIECCTDIAGHLVAKRRLRQPADRKEVFQVLAQAGLLEKSYADVMTKAVGLRNLLVHFYMTVEPDKMYEYLQNDIPYFEQFEAYALGVLDEEQAK